LRLNGRLAPDLYLDCVPIGGDPARPVLGNFAGPAIEYAVRMRRFSQEALLDRALAAGRLEPHHLDTLARRLADFHRSIPIAGPTTRFGDPERVRQPMLDDFVHTRPRLFTPGHDWPIPPTSTCWPPWSAGLWRNPGGCGRG